MRVAFVCPYGAPFFVPLLSALAARCDLSVLFLDSTRRHDVDHREVLSHMDADITIRHALHLRLGHPDSYFNLTAGSSRWLARRSPDAVFVQGFGPEVWESIAWAAIHRVPVVMWIESTPWSGIHRGRLSQTVRRLLVDRAAVHLSCGTAASLFLAELGVSNDRIVEANFAIDGKPLQAAVSGDPMRPPEDPLHVLYVGRLIVRKRPLDVIEAISRSQKHAEVRLRVIGDGPMSAEVGRAVGTLPGAEWLGRRAGEDLVREYRWADIVVVPSARETWGLVVNEALRAGVYILYSDQVGSATDLIPSSEGLGRCFPVGDVDALAGLLRHCVTDLDRSGSGRRVRARMALGHAPGAFSPESWAERAMVALEIATRGGPRTFVSRRST